jgi:hypothetical protein
MSVHRILYWFARRDGSPLADAPVDEALDWTLAVDPIAVRAALLLALPLPETPAVEGSDASLGRYGVLNDRRSARIREEHSAHTHARLCDRLRA